MVLTFPCNLALSMYDSVSQKKRNNSDGETPPLFPIHLTTTLSAIRLLLE